MSNEPLEPSNSKRATLFLSYSHSDDAKARRIASALEEAGYTVWWDALIEGGATFAKSIGSALESADAVIVMWSANSVESDWVRDEAAQGRDRQCLIPISLDGTRPPLGFRQYQVIKFRSWRGRRDAPQFEALEKAISRCSGSPMPPVRSHATRMSRRAALVGGAGAAAAIVGGGTYLAIDRGLFGGKSDESSIAVLPFKNLSGDTSQEYFAEGLTEEIRAALIQLDELRVMAGASSERAGEDEDDLQSIARKLGVGYLLGGSVRKSGDLFRIATELTDGKTGFSLWSTTVDRRLNDILALQGDIAKMVAEALSIQIATDEPLPGGTQNAEAYDHYLQGKSLYHLARDEESDRQALANYDLAIAADPKFAMAHAARSRVLASIAAEYGKADELKPLYAESTASARRAVELAPKLADAHLALGYVLYTGHLDVKGARPSYERAYQLGRGNADIVLLYALYCARAGLPEQAHDAIGRALVLDPLNARVHRAAGSIDYAARLYANALPPLRRSLELNPKISNAHALLGYCLTQLGKLKEARAEFDAEPTNFFRLSGLAIVDHKLGDKAAAESAMAALIKEMGDASLYQQAQVLAQWGNSDEAVVRLERARQIGDSGLIYLATDPLLDPIRKHPGFAKLIRELNLN